MACGKRREYSPFRGESTQTILRGEPDTGGIAAPTSSSGISGRRPPDGGCGASDRRRSGRCGDRRTSRGRHAGHRVDHPDPVQTWQGEVAVAVGPGRDLLGKATEREGEIRDCHRQQAARLPCLGLSSEGRPSRKTARASRADFGGNCSLFLAVPEQIGLPEPRPQFREGRSLFSPVARVGLLVPPGGARFHLTRSRGVTTKPRQKPISTITSTSRFPVVLPDVSEKPQNNPHPNPLPVGEGQGEGGSGINLGCVMRAASCSAIRQAASCFNPDSTLPGARPG